MSVTIGLYAIDRPPELELISDCDQWRVARVPAITHDDAREAVASSGSASALARADMWLH